MSISHIAHVKERFQIGRGERMETWLCAFAAISFCASDE